MRGKVTVGRRYYRLWLPALLRKASLFFLLNTLFVLFLYGIGGFQDFTDSTESFLLMILDYSLILSGFASFFSVFAYIYSIPYRKKSVLSKIILSVLIFTFTLTLYILVNFLQSWF